MRGNESYSLISNRSARRSREILGGPRCGLLPLLGVAQTKPAPLAVFTNTQVSVVVVVTDLSLPARRVRDRRDRKRSVARDAQTVVGDRAVSTRGYLSAGDGYRAPLALLGVSRLPILVFADSPGRFPIDRRLVAPAARRRSAIAGEHVERGRVHDGRLDRLLIGLAAAPRRVSRLADDPFRRLVIYQGGARPLVLAAGAIADAVADLARVDAGFTVTADELTTLAPIYFETGTVVKSAREKRDLNNDEEFL